MRLLMPAMHDASPMRSALVGELKDPFAEGLLHDLDAVTADLELGAGRGAEHPRQADQTPRIRRANFDLLRKRILLRA